MQLIKNPYNKKLRKLLLLKKKPCNLLSNCSQKTLTKSNQVVQKPKFIQQTIQPKTSWRLITEFTKQSLDKLRIEGDTEEETM
jgi:hypothetical protein